MKLYLKYFYLLFRIHYYMFLKFFIFQSVVYFLNLNLYIFKLIKILIHLQKNEFYNPTINAQKNNIFKYLNK